MNKEFSMGGHMVNRVKYIYRRLDNLPSKIKLIIGIFFIGILNYLIEGIIIDGMKQS